MYTLSALTNHHRLGASSNAVISRAVKSRTKMFVLVRVFVLFRFGLLFILETEFLCVALGVLELNLSVGQAGLELPRAGFKGLSSYAQL